MAIETWSPQSTGMFRGNQKPPGEGWTITGYRTQRTPNPKMGSGYSSAQVPIYSRSAAAPAAPAQPQLTVNDLYQTVLGRAPDPEGAAYWQRAFGDYIDAAEAAAFAQAAQKERNPAPAPTTLPTSTYTPPAGPSMANVASQFSSQIAGMQQGFQQSLAQQASQFAAMQQVQEERILALQEQMKQAAAAAAARPTVAGVKTATSSAGTDMQIARRGATGGFNRAGLRIKSLNV